MGNIIKVTDSIVLNYQSRLEPTLGIVNAIKNAHTVINKDSSIYDGEILMVSSIDYSGTVNIFPSRYRWHIANQFDREAFRGVTLGALKTAIIIRNEDKVLWQKRAADLESGMFWTVSASHFVSPTLDVETSILFNLKAELGLEFNHISELAPTGIAVFDSEGIVVCLYTAVIEKEAILKPNVEVADDLLWAELDQPPLELDSVSKSLAQFESDDFSYDNI